MEDDESDDQIWITQSKCSKTMIVGNFNEAIQNEADYDDDNDVTIGKELEIVNSSSRALISDLALHERIKDRIPKVTISSTNWAIKAWEEWGMKRNSEDVNWNDEFVDVPKDIVAIPDIELNYWLAKFVVEVQKKGTGEVYCGKTSYQIVCGLQRFKRENGRPKLNVLEQTEFKLFRDSLGAEMKRLISESVGIEVKQAEPLSREEEDILWRKHHLGGSNPRALSDTMVF